MTTKGGEDKGIKVLVQGGGYRKLPEHEINECKKLGEFLASVGAEIMTGGGTGYPYQVGKAAVKAGARVFGRSPAKNAKEHEEKYGFKFDGITDLIYMDKDFTNHTDGLLQRMQDMQSFSDLVIALGGTWGTLYELLLSFYHKKTIILIQEFEGATTLFNNAYTYFDTRGDINPKVHYGPTLISVKDVGEAIAAIKKYIKDNDMKGGK